MSDFLFGEAPSTSSRPTLTPEQQALLSQLIGGISGNLFAPAAPAGGGVTPTAAATPGVNYGAVPGYIPGYSDGGMDPFGINQPIGLTYDEYGRPINTVTPPAATPASTSMTGVPSYPGDMTAGPSSIQNKIFSQIPGLLGGIGGDKTVNSALDSFLNKYKGGYSAKSFDPTSTLNMFQKSIFDPAMKGYKEETLPQIAELFAGRGSFDSGGTLHTMTESAEDLMASLMGTKASMLDNARTSWDNMELQKFLGINSLLPSVAGAKTNSVTSGLAGLPFAMDIGGTQQGFDQADLNEMFQKWSTSQPYNNPYLNLLSIALGTPTFENVVEGGSTGLLSAMAPGVGYGAGTYLSNLLLS